MRRVALATLVAVASCSPSWLDSLPGPIKHVIVLMQENRSFDHMLGYAKKLLNVNGLNGNECNDKDTEDPSKGKICVDDKSPYIALSDPDHGTPATTSKIFGKAAVAKHDFSNPDMSGFAEWNLNCSVMTMFPPERLPIMVTLAQEFAVMDRFFAAHPGPTWPNRLFALSATSAGLTETGHYYHDELPQLFPQKTIFDQMEEANLPWRVYYQDTPWEMFLEKFAHSPHNAQHMEEFFNDCEKGTLPAYAWINPRSGVNMSTGVGSNDQHPDHDVAAGEAFYKTVYEAIRASPQWNETLFIITYDEHGGFYDHVHTPLKVPPPDSVESYPDKGFEWDRLGVRLPTLLISPWIPKGTVVSAPPAAQKPANNSEYDLTSILSSARKILGVHTTPLTKRDAWSATFEHVLNLTAPRTDCPMHLPPAPPLTLSARDEAKLPLNDLQKHIMQTHARLNDVPFPDHIVEQGQVSEWLHAQFLTHKRRTMDWRRSKEAATYKLNCYSPAATGYFADNTWDITHNASAGWDTVSSKKLVSGGVPYCLDANGGTPGGLATVSLCYPSHDPSKNRDVDQHWSVHKVTSTIEWFNSSLCLTSHMPTNSSDVTLEPCDGRAEQAWAWLGKAPGDDSPSNQIQWAMWSLGIKAI